MRITCIILLLFFISCGTGSSPGIPKPAPNTRTYIPIYLPNATAHMVTYSSPQPMVKTGKTYTIGNYLLQVETDSGIHIIDYANRTAPKKIGFIKSVFCSEMAVKGNFLYINNLDDLVILDISDITKPTEVKRIANAFPKPFQRMLPPVSQTFFECPDPNLGVVIGWKVEVRDYPKCYR